MKVKVGDRVQYEMLGGGCSTWLFGIVLEFPDNEHVSIILYKPKVLRETKYTRYTDCDYNETYDIPRTYDLSDWKAYTSGEHGSYIGGCYPH